MKDFDEAVLEYYKLKKKYEVFFEKEKKLILNQSISNREKRKLFLEFKPKCVMCKQPGGTIFSSTYNSTQFSRELKATCNSKSPCKLNINILVGNYYQLDSSTMDLKSDLDDFKKDVIITKNNQLFGLKNVNDTLETFEKLKDEISDTTDLYINYLDMLNDKINNKVTKDDLDRNVEIVTLSYLMDENAVNNSDNFIKFDPYRCIEFNIFNNSLAP